MKTYAMVDYFAVAERGADAGDPEERPRLLRAFALEILKRRADELGISDWIGVTRSLATRPDGTTLIEMQMAVLDE